MTRRGSESFSTRCSIWSSSDSAATASRPASAHRGRAWQGAVGLLVSALFLYWALRGVSPADIAGELRGADYVLLGLSMLLATLTFPARAARWRIILGRPGGRPELRPVWQATAIGFMANNLLPARTGEVARAYAASRLVGLPLATSFGSLVVERTFDGLVVVLLLAIAIASPGFPGSATVAGTSVSTLAAWTAAVFVLALLVLFALVHAPDGVLAFAARLLRWLLPARAADFTVRVARNFIEGLAILRAPRDFALVLAWSFVVWLVNATAFYVGFLAFHLGDLPFTSSLLLQGIVAIGVAIPSSPGFFGPFEAFSRAGLRLYGVPAEAAVSFAVGTHIGWFVPITAIGLAVLARANLSLRELRGGEGSA